METVVDKRREKLFLIWKSMIYEAQLVSIIVWLLLKKLWFGTLLHFCSGVIYNSCKDVMIVCNQLLHKDNAPKELVLGPVENKFLRAFVVHYLKINQSQSQKPKNA